MKKSEQNCLEVLRSGGAVMASDWTTGRGRFRSRRPIPPFCEEVLVEDVNSLRGNALKAAKRVLRAHPKTQKLIVVKDWRAANKLAKSIL